MFLKAADLDREETCSCLTKFSYLKQCKISYFSELKLEEKNLMAN